MPTHAPNDRPSDKNQKNRTFKNKQRQREKHLAKYPNDKTSVAGARRWTVATLASKDTFEPTKKKK